MLLRHCSPTHASSQATASSPNASSTLQGALLFVGLLLLLWVPLLVFSSGNPTYTVPAVVSFSANATLLAGAAAGGSSGGGGASSGGQQFRLFAAGDRRQQQQWAWRSPGANGSSDGSKGGDEREGLPEALSNYVPQQLQLLCVTSVSCVAHRLGSLLLVSWPCMGQQQHLPLLLQLRLPPHWRAVMAHQPAAFLRNWATPPL